jgi:hypothetical protein
MILGWLHSLVDIFKSRTRRVLIMYLIYHTRCDGGYCAMRIPFKLQGVATLTLEEVDSVEPHVCVFVRQPRNDHILLHFNCHLQ